MEESTKQILRKVAAEYSLEPAALMSVKQVETGNGTGLLVDGSPSILFEGHIFYKLLKEKYGVKKANWYSGHQPTICYPTFNRNYYKGGLAEHLRLQSAVRIDRELALQSASWGLFQIMGFNWKSCNCSSLQDFINKNYKSAEDQARLGCEFLKSSGLIDKLKSKDWKGFARGYNGPNYAVNAYDQKLENCYNNFKRSESKYEK